MTPRQRSRLFRSPQPIVWADAKPQTPFATYALALLRSYTRAFDRKAAKRKRQARQRTGRRR